ncbi:MAG TPA: NlpC/P60 family protein [Acidimicrobiia bacterium]|nr:NlpC/P60 family protein [Acidimicrobiia bacterium]
MFVRRVTSLAVVAVLATVSFGANGVGAAPDTSGAADAARAIEQNGHRAVALAEALKGAELRLSEAKAKLADARAQIEALKVQIAEDRARLAREGAGIYRNASEGNLVPLEVTGQNATARRRIRYGAAAADATRRLVASLVASQAAVAEQEARADDARQAAQDERDDLVRARDELVAAEARQQALLAAAPPEVTQRLTDPTATAGSGTAGPSTPAAGAPPIGTPGTPAPAPPAPTTPAPTSPAPAPPPPSAPAPSSGAAAAVAFAHAQLGKPYVYAASGPNAYDCSGLTMAAWRAGGVSLPHYSGAQYSRLTKVSMHALQPGDLIFWGPGGSEHVAIYIGGGKIISAPYTGAVVRIQGIWGSPIGAARP